MTPVEYRIEGADWCGERRVLSASAIGKRPPRVTWGCRDARVDVQNGFGLCPGSSGEAEHLRVCGLTTLGEGPDRLDEMDQGDA